MKLTEEKLREIFQQQTARTTPRQTECLTEDQFMRAATGEMTSEERRNVARHLITCIDCTEEYRALRSLETWAEDSCVKLTSSVEADSVNALLTSPARADRGRLQRLGDSVAAFWQRLIWEPGARRVAAVAVMIVVAASSVVIWQSIKRKEPPASTERARVSPRLSVEPPNKATLNQPPEKLVWSAVEHAITYRVALYDFQSTPIWESAPLRETSVAIPESVRGRLLRNQPYYWRVFAEDAIDQRQSELFQFTLTANEHR
ncbi:MAG: hypothetical protein AB1631_27925 [Acidobacteriota bacterium]